MQTLHFVILLATIVLLSSVFDQFLPRLALPLVQIVLGAVGALFLSQPLSLGLDPDLFLVLFIAPLLFDESKHVSKRALAKNMGGILSLAIALVFASVLAVGFLLHWASPSVPLAAAFALGAALGPTDAVATSALSPSVALDERQNALLSGEALINDASGIVSFQFAVAAAVTGLFSVADASSAFAKTFLGGLGIGIVLGIVSLILLGIVRLIGLESTVFHVTFELLSPFVIYLLAESLHVSGILAVVAAGLTTTLFTPRVGTSYSARVRLVSSSVWEVLTFVLNGVVFVLLGTQFPSVMRSSWRREGSGLTMVGLVFLLSFALIVLRFVWIYVMEALRGRNWHVPLRDVATTTLAGPKGAVTLSIMFTLPQMASNAKPFPARDELIFLASGIILVTLLLANFLLPVLSPKKGDAKEESRMRWGEAEVLRRTISALRSRHGTSAPLAVAALTRRYNREIRELEEAGTYAEQIRQARLQVVTGQLNHAAALREEEKITEATFRQLQMILSRTKEGLIRRGKTKRRLLKTLPRLFQRLVAGFQRRKRARREQVDPHQILAARVLLEEQTLAELTERKANGDEAAAHLVGEHQELADLLKERLEAYQMRTQRRPMDWDRTKQKQELSASMEALEAEALRLRLGYVGELREEGRITDQIANALRDDVYLLQMNLSGATL
ncbi:Na+/H+ antiporter [Winkia sp. ACRQY]|uniref:Na+/H+ antiporter n=1 Tax=Winkia TaxID=2692118 RepID=UPI001EF336F0|nr:Na+/H+ antiporter [Winkia neuii]MCG7302555.1 Na+/H+ antiporter [Winkia sp. ACRQY]WEB72193.1 Na+/H+ antiporter [Winkia neuii]